MWHRPLLLTLVVVTAMLTGCGGFLNSSKLADIQPPDIAGDVADEVVAKVVVATDRAIGDRVERVSGDVAQAASAIRDVSAEVGELRREVARLPKTAPKAVREVIRETAPAIQEEFSQTELGEHLMTLQGDMTQNALRVEELATSIQEAVRLANAVRQNPPSMDFASQHGPAGGAGLLLSLVAFFLGRLFPKKKE